MANVSRSQDREERTKMGQGMIFAVAGLVLCWLPVVGLLLSIIGFIKLAVRITQRHKKRLVVYTIVGLLSLVVSTGALLGEVWVYSRNPNVLEEVKLWTWTKLTGQTTLPGQQALTGGTDYTGLDYPGLGAEYQEGVLDSGEGDAGGTDDSLSGGGFYGDEGEQGTAFTPEDGAYLGEEGETPSLPEELTDDEDLADFPEDGAGEPDTGEEPSGASDLLDGMPVEGDLLPPLPGEGGAVG